MKFQTVNQVEVDIELYANSLGFKYEYDGTTCREFNDYYGWWHTYRNAMWIIGDKAKIFRKQEKCLKLIQYIELKLGREFNVEFKK